MQQYDSVIQALCRRRFIARAFATSAEANAEILNIIGSGSVGSGGSRTIADMGLYDAVRAHGNTLYCHTFAEPEQKQTVRKLAMGAGVYLSGTNAVTEDGTLVNIDGTGNRAAAMLFGPETVIVVAGKNKIVRDYDAAIQRIKADCCPVNARRLGLSTPCALTGKCADCSTPARMCNATIVHEYPTRNVKAFYVFLVDETLGW